MKRYLIRNSKIYPNSAVTDYFKLIYQSVYGVGHLIPDISKAKQYLLSEMNNISYDKFEPLYEYISDSFVRVNLRPYKMFNLNIDSLLNAMVDCANTNNGTYKEAARKIAILRKLATDKVININVNEIDDIINKYENELPLFHHSEEYRKCYQPHYRVVRSDFVDDKLRELNFMNFVKSMEKGIVAIDGNCCTGKSYLSEKSGLTVIHIDDFFPENGQDRIQYSLANKAICNISHTSDFTYQAFDCTNRCYYDKTLNKASSVVLVEGVYSLDPKMGKYYDCSILFKCSYDIRLERLRNRCSDYVFNKFINVWIPNEDKYFNESTLIENVNIII